MLNNKTYVTLLCHKESFNIITLLLLACTVDYMLYLPLTFRDGIGRTGMFCALISMVDSMRSDKMVDVFQEVKRLRMCRPGMVENVVSIYFASKETYNL